MVYSWIRYKSTQLTNIINSQLDEAVKRLETFQPANWPPKPPADSRFPTLGHMVNFMVERQRAGPQNLAEHLSSIFPSIPLVGKITEQMGKLLAAAMQTTTMKVPPSDKTDQMAKGSDEAGLEDKAEESEKKGGEAEFSSWPVSGEVTPELIAKWRQFKGWEKA
jgi:hypothetical protein